MLRRLLLTAALALASPAFAQDECSRPYPLNLPGMVPEDRETMLDLQGRVKDYLAKAESYLACNEAEQQVLAGDLDDPDLAEDAQVQIQVLVTRYNNTVDEMHAVGERFNALVREYKTAAAKDG